MFNADFISKRVKFVCRQTFDFSGENLAEAIRLTFGHRETKIPSVVSAFSKDFIQVKQSQWTVLLRRLQLAHVSEDFSDVVFAIKDFIEPLVSALSSGTFVPANWSAPGPWT